MVRTKTLFTLCNSSSSVLFQCHTLSIHSSFYVKWFSTEYLTPSFQGWSQPAIWLSSITKIFELFIQGYELSGTPNRLLYIMYTNMQSIPFHLELCFFQRLVRQLDHHGVSLVETLEEALPQSRTEIIDNRKVKSSFPYM